ncbi:glycoside hydrolase family 18 protein [Paenibacillus sp. SYP-B3998]|uniref:chitinase n=1 Tax=Paenibacillus sp. SYP-B3998 TaxID=2678564 RepID=A0A6G3ZXI1_9BACL|nr:glycoside hydrolase family 18 protein [Paenibacillus sp. SYP-B3998]NEW06281.1 glycoside hydrolase family 18 protein [Paenibacillus sp. SYP-B3998]
MTYSTPIVTAYATDESLPLLTQEDANRLTHLNIAFGLVRDHEVHVDDMRNMSYVRAIKSYNPKLNILLSIGGWGAGGFSEAASSIEGRQTFAKTSVNLLKKYELDGLDIDWEYPSYAAAGIQASPKDRITFTLLLKELREQLDQQGQADNRRYLLTIAAGADQYYIDGTEMDKVQDYLDLIQLMTYDMRGGFQTLTGHHTNLYTPSGDLFRISVQASVQLFMEAGVPAEKIVIGAAFYSRQWQGVPNINHGLHQMTSSFGGYGATYSQLTANFIDKNGFQRYWDDEAKAPYLYDGSTFISYDDPDSLRAKCTYIRETGIAGIMFWEYGQDDSSQLLKTLWEELGE